MSQQEEEKGGGGDCLQINLSPAMKPQLLEAKSKLSIWVDIKLQNLPDLQEKIRTMVVSTITIVTNNVLL